MQKLTVDLGKFQKQYEDLKKGNVKAEGELRKEYKRSF